MNLKATYTKWRHGEPEDVRIIQILSGPSVVYVFVDSKGQLGTTGREELLRVDMSQFEEPDGAA